MRTGATTAVLMLSLALGSGCDSTQPTRRGEAIATLNFTAPNGRAQLVRTWTMFEDSNGDNRPDDVNADGEPDEFLWCDPQVDAGGNPIPGLTQSIPWNYSVVIEIIRAGTVTPETVIFAVDRGDNLTEYDRPDGGFTATRSVQLLTHRRGSCSLDTAILCNPDEPQTGSRNRICPRNSAGTCLAEGRCSVDPTQTCRPDSVDTVCAPMGLGSCNSVNVTRRFVFPDSSTPGAADSRMLRTTASREVLQADFNILTDTSQTFANGISGATTGGRCPGSDLGDPNAGPMLLPLELDLNVGDTLMVEARRFSTAPAGSNLNLIQAPGLSSQLIVDGRNVTFDVCPNSNPQCFQIDAGEGSEGFIKFFFTLE